MSRAIVPDSVPGWMHELVLVACMEHGLHRTDVLTRKRDHQAVVRVMAIALRARGASWPEVACALRYRSHATAYELVHGKQKQKGLRQ